MLSGEGFDYQCHSNLTRAILPYGLTEFDVHDVLNVFQVTGLNENGQYVSFVVELCGRDTKRPSAVLSAYEPRGTCTKCTHIRTMHIRIRIFNLRILI